MVLSDEGIKKAIESGDLEIEPSSNRGAIPNIRRKYLSGERVPYLGSVQIQSQRY